MEVNTSVLDTLQQQNPDKSFFEVVLPIDITLRNSTIVIPAPWIPAFAGMTRGGNDRGGSSAVSWCYVYKLKKLRGED